MCFKKNILKLFLTFFPLFIWLSFSNFWQNFHFVCFLLQSHLLNSAFVPFKCLQHISSHSFILFSSWTQLWTQTCVQIFLFSLYGILQHGTPPYYAQNVCPYLYEVFPNRWIGTRSNIERQYGQILTHWNFFLCL